MNFYKNKFNINADYYFKKTTDLLFTTSLAGYLGSIPSPTVNIGSTTAQGIDLTLGYTDKFMDNKLGLNTTIAFTTVKGNVTSTGASGAIRGGGFFNGQSQTTTLFAPGFAPGVYFGYKTAGLFQTVAEIARNLYAQANILSLPTANVAEVINSTTMAKSVTAEISDALVQQQNKSSVAVVSKQEVSYLLS